MGRGGESWNANIAHRQTWPLYKDDDHYDDVLVLFIIQACILLCMTRNIWKFDASNCWDNTLRDALDSKRTWEKFSSSSGFMWITGGSTFWIGRVRQKNINTTFINNKTSSYCSCPSFFLHTCERRKLSKKKFKYLDIYVRSYINNRIFIIKNGLQDGTT